ncbi:MAG TPA: ATP-binding cassette domain-containing protein [Azospirillum sp.]|nr:ATP-binding cassette domain-containing protein [Azospirillum sp.]
MTETLLRIRGLSKSFGGVIANADVDFELPAGGIASIIGPNGAGKTTFISMVSGHLKPTAGSIEFRGRDVTRLSVEKRARLGISRKFQTPSIFPNLSVWENVELAVLASRRRPRDSVGRIAQVLDLVRLVEFAEYKAVSLSHGQRQWLEIGLLLGNDADLLLLDEPTAGMTAAETHATAELIRRLSRELGLSAVIIEHDIQFIRDLRAPVTVLHLGRVFAQGSFEAISADERVRSIYLGKA